MNRIVIVALSIAAAISNARGDMILGNTEQPGIEPNVVQLHYAQASQVAALLNPIIAFSESLGTNGFTQGKTLIVPDDRSNVLFIITRPENMVLFEKLIAILDVEVDEPTRIPPPAQDQTLRQAIPHPDNRLNLFQ